MIEVGATAPDFALRDADDHEVTLESLRGRPVVLYFYPRDDTPGCTTQACDIRDAWGEFEAAGAAVVGVSPDTSAAHARFRSKYDLPHVLLADPDHGVIEAYGAWGEKRNYGRTYQGVIRSTVLIDAAGTVVAHWPKVDAKKHADQVLAALRELQTAS